ncbi:endonuclease/exonuclease/phosphatase family protein [Evansella halocellulosilytica]|uniref:endonuclease/exonuclease/phosphatase family protein n=1 Tax=Evansella halocellulosilytica TaxID=2011013 RepID=UPI000BB7C66D|nr:endonuclease/exonuclease/phosphatase family protein [Evansella halocellulosilytica]
MEINVMTFNIHHGKGLDRKVDLERIGEVIEKSDADVIGLNEVDRHFSKRSHYEDQIKWLASQLNMEHDYSPSLTLKSRKANQVRQYGNALLSRLPILSSNSYPLHFMKGFIEGRSLLEATIQSENKPFQVYITHLCLNPFLHKKQSHFIINQIQRSPFPVVVMGDWNMRPNSSGWKKMTEHLQDPWVLSGRGNGSTFPSSHPQMRLDYIFCSNRFKVTNAEVVSILPYASDHLPVKVTLAFPK